MTHRAPLIIEPYSNAWPAAFEAERELILSVLPTGSFCVEHIGSTAVSGLSAKPIIDIMIGGETLMAIEGQRDAICSIGYQYLPETEATLPERRFFAKPPTRPRQFHLHAVPHGSSFWIDHLLFRDALRESPSLVRDYAQLKHALANAYGDDREGYTNAKTTFITQAVQKARKTRSG